MLDGSAGSPHRHAHEYGNKAAGIAGDYGTLREPKPPAPGPACACDSCRRLGDRHRRRRSRKRPFLRRGSCAPSGPPFNPTLRTLHACCCIGSTRALSASRRVLCRCAHLPARNSAAFVTDEEPSAGWGERGSECVRGTCEETAVEPLCTSHNRTHRRRRADHPAVWQHGHRGHPAVVAAEPGRAGPRRRRVPHQHPPVVSAADHAAVWQCRHRGHLAVVAA